MTKLADGCCSAVTPCSWQRTNPSTICDTCRAASPSVSAWLSERANASRSKSKDAMHAKDDRTAAWHAAQTSAFEAAHAYAVARPERSCVASDQGAAAQIVSARLCSSQEGHGSVDIALAGGLRVMIALEAPHEPSAPKRLPMVPDIADVDLAYLAGLAISSKDTTLARIAAALLLAR